MCMLCSDVKEKQEAARAEARLMADMLRRLSAAYSCLARGEVKPHSDEWAALGSTARLALRNLVEDWM